MDLASLQTTVSRISARLNENLSETARDLGLQGLDPASLAGVGAAGRYLEDGTVVSQDGVRETKKLLESRREASMTEGLRRVLAMMLRGLPVVTFFPQVVQCLSSSSSSNTTSSASAIHIRSLVSMYILRQAAFEQDLALLAVNMYQKDLRDPNPVIRALAIRTLAGMELDSIVTLVLMSLKTASRDSNWFVRRTVAEALERVYVLDPSHLTSLLPILETGLADQNPLVTGSSLAAFESICPDRLELLHPHYRRYCKTLVDADEWTQVILLRVLELYARQQFANPEKGKMDPDLRLLLQCTEPLLWNRNPAVVLSVVRITYRLAPSSFSKRHAAALGRLLQAPPEIQGTVLAAIASIASEKPSYFAQHLRYFYVYQLFDNQANKLLKLQILVLLVDESNIKTILGEFISYTKVLDPTFRRQVVSSIGDCARKVTKVQSACLKTLVELLDEYIEDEVTAALLHEISQILLAQDTSLQLVNSVLAELLIRHTNDRFDSPNSRAEFYRTLSLASRHLGDILPNALDVVRRGAKAFPLETEAGKKALLRLSSKLLVLCQKASSPDLLKISSTLHTYLLTLGRYDPSWSIRASTRMYAGLTNTVKPPSPAEEEDEAAQQERDAFASGEAIAIAPIVKPAQDKEDDKLVPLVQSVILGESQKSPAVAEVSVVGKFEKLAGWQPLPDWPETAPQHKQRDTVVEAPVPANKAYTGFGSSSMASRSGSSSRSTGQHSLAQQAGPSKRRTEKVVLVPTDSYTPPEKPRPSDLNAFLQSSDEGEDDVDEEETESETESETDSTDAPVAAAQKAKTPEMSESEEDTSSEDDESDEAEGADAPLVRLDQR